MLVLSSRMSRQLRARDSGVCASWLALISRIRRLRGCGVGGAGRGGRVAPWAGNGGYHPAVLPPLQSTSPHSKHLRAALLIRHTPHPPSSTFSSPHPLPYSLVVVQDVLRAVKQAEVGQRHRRAAARLAAVPRGQRHGGRRVWVLLQSVNALGALSFASTVPGCAAYGKARDGAGSGGRQRRRPAAAGVHASGGRRDLLSVIACTVAPCQAGRCAAAAPARERKNPGRSLAALQGRLASSVHHEYLTRKMWPAGSAGGDLGSRDEAAGACAARTGDLRRSSGARGSSLRRRLHGETPGVLQNPWRRCPPPHAPPGMARHRPTCDGDRLAACLSVDYISQVSRQCR